MKVLFMLISLFFLYLPFLTDSHALTAQEELNVALKEKLILTAADLKTQIEPSPPLFNKDLCLAEIYKNTGFIPLWVSATGPGPHAEIIFHFLKYSEDEGLDPRRYDIDEITNLWQTKNPASLARLDMLLTYNLVKYIHDITYGSIRPPPSDIPEFTDNKKTLFNVVSVIKSALNASDLKAYLISLAPSHHYYRDLKAALKIYRAIAASGGWQQIPQGKTIHPGDKDARLPLIYKRLISPGIRSIPPLEGTVYGLEMQEVVKIFQRLNGIEVDGIIGSQTLAAMNIPASRLVEQIIVNMARWRWQAHKLGNQYVMINIANFTLTAFNNGKMVLSVPVIIGQQQHQTPVFSDSIKYIEFNPFWTIPPNIAKNEELPNLRKNKQYLANRHVRLFNGWRTDAIELDSTKIDWQKVTRSQIAGFKLRQDPGPWNALGRIKFGFPNKYSVYMHDTPTKDLFAHNKRDFSHGCIRLSNPLALAIFALEDQGQGWTKEKVESYFYSDKRMIIRLTSPIPIHITYQTTWVDKDGRIHFNKDIYGRDEKLYKELQSSYDKIETDIHK